jgi:hypothetical protein
MATEIAGYRAAASETCTASTHTIDFDSIPDGHKVYIERVACEADLDNADFEFCVVSGGQEFPFADEINVVADIAHGKRAGCWIYTGEHVRVNVAGVGDGYTVKAWLLGVDKWEVEGG